MGATTFFTTSDEQTAEAAFSSAHESAKFEYGHGGYTGTIAEKYDYTVIDESVRTRQQAEQFASDLLNADDPRISDKWGPAGALPYWDAPTTDRTVSFRMRVNNPTDPHRSHGMEIEAFVYASNNYAKDGETVSSTDVSAPVKVRTKKASAATKGATLKTFRVEEVGTYSNRLISEHETMAGARAAMDAVLADHAARDRAISLEIVARVTRADGGPLAAGSVEIEYADYDVTATLSKVAPTPTTAPTGWLFFGWASE